MSVQYLEKNIWLGKLAHCSHRLGTWVHRKAYLHLVVRTDNGHDIFIVDMR